MTLFAINYVYSTEGDGFYRDSARTGIDEAYKGVNRILKENGIGVQVLSLATFDKNVPTLNVSNVSPDVGAMVAAHEGRPDIVGVHWSEWYLIEDNFQRGWAASAACDTQQCNWINMIGQIRNYQDEAALGVYLARAFGAYLNLPEVSDPANLESNAGLGKKLTSAQREMMWETINFSRSTLLSETCDPPVGLAPRRPAMTTKIPPPETFTGKPRISSGVN